MQNDDRFKGLMELMLPGVQQIWNALYDLPTDAQVTYEDTLSRVIYDSANHHYSNTIPHDRCPLLLFIRGQEYLEIRIKLVISRYIFRK
jgi:hypothetical protein